MSRISPILGLIALVFIAISPLHGEGNPFSPKYHFDADHIDTLLSEEMGLALKLRDYHLCEHGEYNRGQHFYFRNIYNHALMIHLFVDEFYEEIDLEDYAGGTAYSFYSENFQHIYQCSFEAGEESNIPMIWHMYESWNQLASCLYFVNGHRGFCLRVIFPKHWSNTSSKYYFDFRDLMMDIRLFPPEEETF